jgi:hypothetical protein
VNKAIATATLHFAACISTTSVLRSFARSPALQ